MSARRRSLEPENDGLGTPRTKEVALKRGRVSVEPLSEQQNIVMDRNLEQTYYEPPTPIGAADEREPLRSLASGATDDMERSRRISMAHAMVQEGNQSLRVDFGSARIHPEFADVSGGGSISDLDDVTATVNMDNKTSNLTEIFNGCKIADLTADTFGGQNQNRLESVPELDESINGQKTTSSRASMGREDDTVALLTAKSSDANLSFQPSASDFAFVAEPTLQFELAMASAREKTELPGATVAECDVSTAVESDSIGSTNSELSTALSNSTNVSEAEKPQSEDPNVSSATLVGEGTMDTTPFDSKDTSTPANQAAANSPFFAVPALPSRLRESLPNPESLDLGLNESAMSFMYHEAACGGCSCQAFVEAVSTYENRILKTKEDEKEELLTKLENSKRDIEGYQLMLELEKKKVVDATQPLRAQILELTVEVERLQAVPAQDPGLLGELESLKSEYKTLVSELESFKASQAEQIQAAEAERVKMYSERQAAIEQALASQAATSAAVAQLSEMRDSVARSQAEHDAAMKAIAEERRKMDSTIRNYVAEVRDSCAQDIDALVSQQKNVLARTQAKHEEQLAELKTEVGELQALLDARDDKIRRGRARYLKLEEERNNLDAEIQKMKSTGADSGEQVEKLKASLAESEKRAAELVSKNEDLTVQIVLAQSKLGEAENALREAEETLSLAHQKESQLTNELEETKTKLTDADFRFAKTEAEMNSAKSHLAAIQEEISFANSQIQELVTENDYLKNKVAEFEKTMDDCEEEIEKMRRDRVIICKRVVALEEQLKSCGEQPVVMNAAAQPPAGSLQPQMQTALTPTVATPAVADETDAKGPQGSGDVAPAVKSPDGPQGSGDVASAVSKTGTDGAGSSFAASNESFKSAHAEPSEPNPDDTLTSPARRKTSFMSKVASPFRNKKHKHEETCAQQ